MAALSAGVLTRSAPVWGWRLAAFSVRSSARVGGQRAASKADPA
ncbi:MAG: hypothetical protein ACK4SN_04600 [Bellilinea sp.]